MLLEPDPPMPLDEALRLAEMTTMPGAPMMIGARAIRALLDYIEVLELECGRRRALPAVEDYRAKFTPLPVERIEVQR